METITSKRHPIKFYLAIVGIFLYFGGLGFYVIYICDNASKTMYSGEIFGLIFGLFTLILGVYFLKTIIKASPTIKIRPDIISFNSTEFEIKKIKKINFTGLIKLDRLFNLVNACIITFNDGTRKYFIDSMYYNTPEMKLYLRSLVYKNYSRKKSKFIDAGEHKFKGNPYLNYYLLIIVAFALLYISQKIQYPDNPSIHGLLLACLLYYMIFSINLFYLEIAKDKLIIKNHYLFWYKKEYNLNNIKEVNIAHRYRRGNGITIYDHDFSKSLYVCSTLKKKDWNKLEKILQSQDIEIYNLLS